MQLNMKPYNFDKENIPPSYQPISWFDARERIPSDYGVPEGWKPDPTKPDYHDLEAMKRWEAIQQDKLEAEGYYDWERSNDYLAANVF